MAVQSVYIAQNIVLYSSFPAEPRKIMGGFWECLCQNFLYQRKDRVNICRCVCFLAIFAVACNFSLFVATNKVGVG